MKLRYLFLTGIVGAALTGCGSVEDTDSLDQGLNIGAAVGGGGGVVAPPASNKQTADLLATVQFDFSTSWDMDINFALPLDNTYLSLCTDYKILDNGAVDVMFDSCIVRASITDGQYMSEDVPMTNSIESLIAVLIDYSNPSTPMYTEFTVQPGKGSLEWSEGVNL